MRQDLWVLLFTWVPGLWLISHTDHTIFHLKTHITCGSISFEPWQDDLRYRSGKALWSGPDGFCGRMCSFRMSFFGFSWGMSCIKLGYIIICIKHLPTGMNHTSLRPHEKSSVCLVHPGKILWFMVFSYIYIYTYRICIHGFMNQTYVTGWANSQQSTIFKRVQSHNYI